MDYEMIKKQANEILTRQAAECSYIEYKKSASSLDKILKTICAYGNNYNDHELQYLFIGVEEKNDEMNKATPILPISGISEGALEKCKNSLNSLRPYMYPNVSFEIISNELDGIKYIILVVPRQTGGPFMVSDRAEKDKRIKLRPGRYIRIEADTRMAKVDEEYDLLRKFSNFHFSSITNYDAVLDDLDSNVVREYLNKVSSRKITEDLSMLEMARTLHILDKNDPFGTRVRNFAVLMFALHPESYIPYAYVEMIIDLYGTKRKMESRNFKGPIWKTYYQIVKYIDDNFLNTLTLREEGKAENRRVSNFTFVAVEELVANAIVHNNYENEKPIQIYISDEQINIVNYNRPLPPLKIHDLNQRSYFNERDTENPEIRDMFKDLGIIESFGTGIGEAKQSLIENGSPVLYYKEFDDNYNVTSVVIPVNREYQSLKTNVKPNIDLGIESETQVVKCLILDSQYSAQTKDNMMKLYESLRGEVFSNSRIVEILGCSETTATTYIKKLSNDLNVIVPVTGMGKGRYRFKEK